MRAVIMWIMWTLTPPAADDLAGGRCARVRSYLADRVQRIAERTR